MCLNNERIQKIEYSIKNQNKNNSQIFYFNDKDIYNNKVSKDSIDLIFSQATMEHIDNVSNEYKSMKYLLKPEGLISNSIDFRSHGYASTWDKHWEYSDLYWKLLRGKRPYLINRLPLSEHLRLMEIYNFSVIDEQTIKANSNINNRSSNKNFINFKEYDFTASVSYILGRKNS